MQAGRQCFSKVTVVPLLSSLPPSTSPTSPSLKGNFPQEYYPDSDNVLLGIFGVTLTRKFDNLRWKIA